MQQKLNNIITSYDTSGTIGRRYARSDEIGIPYAITVDYDTIDDNSVTIRNRDTFKQVRIKIDELPDTILKLINGSIEFDNL